MTTKTSNPVHHHLQGFLQRCKVAGPILLAVSGGPDSVCLLHAMSQMVDPKALHVAHYNHHLRADASDADAEYVRQLCTEHSLKFHLGEAKAGELIAGQSHLESQARRLRYQWLAEVAQQTSCRWIMTGHTMNDQAETVLHHLIRGTGWRGLRGIAPSCPLPSPLTPLPGGKRGACRLLRPLIDCTRQDILNYIKLNNLTPRHDASNDDLRFTRNRLRHQVLPKLMDNRPDIVQHLAHWSNIAREHYSNLLRAARQAEQQVVVHRTNSALALKQQAMQSLSDDELQVLLHRLWKKQRWAQDAMNAQRWVEVMEVCRGTRTAVELPGRLMVRSKHGIVRISSP